jgi:hypothetical protein
MPDRAFSWSALAVLMSRRSAFSAAIVRGRSEWVEGAALYVNNRQKPRRPNRHIISLPVID